MRSISELSKEANAYEFSPQISFASWIHVSRTLLRESQVYDVENADLERAFVLYLRFADLVLNQLRKHPEFGSHKNAYSKLTSQVAQVIERSEIIKEKLKQQKVEEKLHKTQTQKTVQAQNDNQSEGLDLESELERYENDDIHVPDVDLNIFRSIAYHNESTKTAYGNAHDPQTHHKVIYDIPFDSSPQVQSSSHEEPKELEEPFNPGQISLEFKSVFRTEKGEPLRTVFVPSQLRSKFLAIAEPNTKSNLETCGMLCGKLKRNAFFVTDLVIPSQISTSDSCQTTNEEELFEYIDSRDLFILGWIHTHPTQTCFMSSVDLHTHASYQLMLPEAIAIVCAPTASPDWGAFRLTDPPGIGIIKACKLGGFHQHMPSDDLYIPARPEGHYKEIQFELQVKDLRR